MRRFILAIAALSFASAAYAQTIDRVETKNGSVYYGFISEQTPGSQVMVYAENAAIVLKSTKIINKRRDHFDFNRLSDSSKEIVKTTLRCDTAKLQVYSFEYDGQYYENLYLSDYMDSTVRAYALTPRTYTVKWNDIYKSTRLVQNDDPYGIRDIVILKSGERYIGQITEQQISQSITIKEDNGTVRSVLTSNVLSISSEKIAEKSTIWEQTPLLDRVIMNDRENPIQGLIISRLFGQHIRILPNGGGEAYQIPLKNIIKYQKTRNPEYQPYVLDTAKVVKINALDVKPQSLVLENGVYAYTDTLEYTFFVGDEVKLSLKNVPYKSTVALYECTPVKEKTFMNLLKKEKDVNYVIAEDACPIYEAPLNEEDDFMVWKYTAKKEGKYFLAIDGFNAGVNLVFVRTTEN